MCTIGLLTALTLALSSAPASALAKIRHQAAHRDKETEHVSKEPFGDIPKGPLQIYVSIDQQKLHLYSDGIHIADSSVATGVPSLPTPLGVFSIIQKQRFHVSNIYSNAPMPFMQRITWSGVALHEGENIGHPASHGCIRMPHDFAVRLFGVTKLGVRVVVARSELKPAEFADPHLFVHKDRPPDQPVVAPASPDAVKTAPADGVQTAQADTGIKATDTVAADPAAAVKPDQLGLRVGNDGAATAPDPAAIDGPKPASAPPRIATAADIAPTPAAKPAAIAKDVPAKKTPIEIFISRKEKKIYVRQDFEPLFDAAITIEHPDQLLGTHVFTAMEFLDDHAALRWNVVSLPGEPPPQKPARSSESDKRSDKYAGRRRKDEDSAKAAGELPPPQTPAEALARIEIPQNAIDYISQLIVPGSSLIVSDQGLGDETGDGTGFIVVTR
jgi:L,D-transpeptidase catalytic domain